MRASMAYFAGAGTVIAAIVGGVGGGLLIADMISPKSPKQELTLLERRTPPVQAVAGASEPVAYLAAPQPSGPNPATAAAPVPTQANAQADNSASTPTPPVDAAAGSNVAASLAQPVAPATQAAATTQAATREQTATPEQAFAKPRDADAKRTTERRRVDRRQQWTEKRRYQQRPDQELRAVEDRVREETEPRREFAVEPARIESPRIRLFGLE
jgi:hypothetical protein